MAETFILDTSAIFTYTEEETGVEEVHAVLTKAQNRQATLFIPCMVLMEAYYRRWQATGEDSAKDLLMLLKHLPGEIVEYSEDLMLKAGRIKACYALSLGDAWIAATAEMKNGILVHKDPEFEPLSDRIVLRSLPYKPRVKSKR